MMTLGRHGRSGMAGCARSHSSQPVTAPGGTWRGDVPGRATPRTVWPLCTSERQTCRPRKPVAPVTRIVSLVLIDGPSNQDTVVDGLIAAGDHRIVVQPQD